MSVWVASGIKAIQVIDEGRGVVGVIEIAMGGQDTGPAYIRMRLPLARGPLDPHITTLLDQPPGRAAAPALSRRTVAPPGRLKRVDKRVLDKAPTRKE